MLWLWILGILIALFLLLCLTRVGIYAQWRSNALTLDVRIGLLRFHLPSKDSKATAEPKDGADAADSKPSSRKKKQAVKPTFADIKDVCRVLWPPLKRALHRLGRGVRITPLQVSLTIGGQEDPAAAAQQYGAIYAWLWTLMPQAEQLLDIPDPRIHIGLDFDTAETTAEAEVGISIRIGTLLAVAFGAGIPALRWYLGYQKKGQKTATAPEAVRT
ncbi:MAG: DUF2953 domain-containing protein [Ruminococcaceae bacterium]|nr:DUF2953 domain-containing protein [Oscillospiraceae bacterium]